MPDPADPAAPQRPDLHPSAAVRWLLVAVGIVATLLGIVGAFVPVLPTTPFLLVAAACFARASPKLDRMLTGSATFGPTILEWRRHRSIPWRTKLVAIGPGERDDRGVGGPLSASVVGSGAARGGGGGDRRLALANPVAGPSPSRTVESPGCGAVDAARFACRSTSLPRSPGCGS
ncbi:MAG: YbaN family protein [Betaproteobacteria bacterium]|nr:YbaN family protein [Betaproteobacteria bacterium]